MDNSKRLYEAMFLVDTAKAASDWDGTIGAIQTVLDRADAEVVSLRKWDERKLAYDVNKATRGTYVLVYFNGDPGKISGIERDVVLSEDIMRVLVLRGDHLNEDVMAEDTPLAVAEKKVAEAVAAREAREAEAAEAKAKEESEQASVEKADDEAEEVSAE